MATGFYRVTNTVVSGNSTQSSLNGANMRLLMFDAACRQTPQVVLGLTNTLTVSQFIQASISSLGLDASSTGPALINLGYDTASQASSYVQLFNLNDLSQSRLLTFHLHASTNNVVLGNTGGSSNNIKIYAQGLSGPTPSYLLFNSAAQVGGGNSVSGSGAGIKRYVVLQPVNILQGTEQVKFTILPYSS